MNPQHMHIADENANNICTYMDQSDPKALELVDKLSLHGVRDGAFPDQCKGGMAGSGTGLDYEFPDVASPTNDQNSALLGHGWWWWSLTRKCGYCEREWQGKGMEGRGKLGRCWSSRTRPWSVSGRGYLSLKGGMIKLPEWPFVRLFLFV